jgi:hypothetical protein
MSLMMAVGPWIYCHDSAVRASVRIAILVLAFAVTLILRVRGISGHFWLLGDQIRDWSIALGPFSDLPLVGPPTHVHGYTIGPAFYWILWAIRVTLGPFFENLPHAGGIGQAVLQSGADTLLLAAVWHRTKSVWIGLTATALVATAAYDLCLAPLVWNPVVGSTLAKTATALILLDWPGNSNARVAVTAAVAWTAVHAYTGAVFVTIGVLGALLLEPLARRDRSAAGRRLLVIAAVVITLQLPHLMHQIARGFGDPAMGAVTGSVARVLSGADPPQFAKSLAGYAAAVDHIQVAPWRAAWSMWLLTACALVVAWVRRADGPLLAVTLVPQAAAIIGYALYLDWLGSYYYLSLMPAAVLTVLVGTTALVPARFATPVGVALLAAAVALVPGRLRYSATLHKMPEYGALVHGSRTIARRGQAMRAIQTEFALLPTSDSTFVYRILGGRFDRASPWVAVIANDGRVTYEHVQDQ